MNVQNKLGLAVENKNELEDFWNDIDCDDIRKFSWHLTEIKKKFPTPDFNSSDLNKISPIYKTDNNPEEKDTFLTFEQFKDEKEFTLQKQKTIKEKLKEFLLKYETAEDKKNPLTSSTGNLNPKSIKKVGEARSKILYEKGMIKNELIKMICNKNSEIKSQDEMKECTFKPMIIKSIKSLTNIASEKEKDPVKTLYDRNLYWRTKANEKIIKEKSMKCAEEQYSFKPQLNKNNLDNVFSQNEKPNYLTYVNRIEQVRRDQEEKQKQTNIRLPKNDNPKWSNYTRKISSPNVDSHILYDNTQKSSLTSLEDVKRSLHYKLHS